MKYKVVIGILTFSPYATGTDILKQCLDSIYKNTDMTDVHVIVGNNSETPEIIRSITDLCINYPNLTLINFKKDRCGAHVWNIMTRMYDSDIMVLACDDTMVYPYWLEATKLALENNPDIGTISYDTWYTNTPYDYKVPDNARIWANECIYPLTSIFAFRRDVYNKIQGFDEGYCFWFIDIDIGIVLMKNGYFNYVLGTANEKGFNEYHFARHIGGASGAPQDNSGAHFVAKYGFGFPLSKEVEENLKIQRNKTLIPRLPRIENGRVVI